MRRRTFIKTVVASGLVVGTGGVVWLLSGNNQGAYTIDAALLQLDELADKKLVSSGEWDVSEIFAHCAQSVEYSMIGYPQHSSAIFKNTVGKLAFSIFAAKKAMSHSLSDPIPGAPPLQANADFHDALARLRSALTVFRDYNGQMQPHFAYGNLSKDDYTLAHVIHINNHLQQIEG